MTDNETRAIRVAEIMTDFRNLQYYLATLQANPPPEDYYLEGYSLLRACVAEGQTVLTSSYHHTSQNPSGNVETEKAQLLLYVFRPTQSIDILSSLFCQGHRHLLSFLCGYCTFKTKQENLNLD
jgi:hypothetical protein